VRFEEATGVRIYQGYGLTESTGIAAGTPIGARAPVDPASGVLAAGRAVAGTDVRVVGEDGLPVPSGARGETGHAIRDGWLHTGDIGVLDDQGWLYVVDRLKDLIVASGFTVWPGEVEEVLLRHPEVAEVAVVGEADDDRGETVVAHVAMNPRASATEADLLAHCRVELAAYKCPTRLVIHDELPKSASGKVLRRLLRYDDPGRPGLEAPR